jgi:hypothetical protein
MVMREQPRPAVDDTGLAVLAVRCGVAKSDLDGLATFAQESPARSLLDFIPAKQDLKALFQRSGDLVEARTPDSLFRDDVWAAQQVMAVGPL